MPEAAATAELAIEGGTIRLTTTDYHFWSGELFDSEGDGAGYEIRDDLVVNADTGELIGLFIPEGVEMAADPEKITDGFADWIMGKILRHDSRRASARRAADSAAFRIGDLQRVALERLASTPEMIELQTIATNAAKIVHESENTLTFFHSRYDRLLGAWAAMQIGTSKGRTWATPFGSIALKKVPASLQVDDEEAVIEWAKEAAPTAVKTETSLLIRGIPKEMRAALIAGTAGVAGLSVVPESEKVTVTSNAQ